MAASDATTVRLRLPRMRVLEMLIDLPEQLVVAVTGRHTSI